MSLPPNGLNVIIGFMVLLGAVQCFLGYRIFKVILGLTGFFIGGLLAGSAGYDVSQQELVALLAGLVGGIIGAAVLVGLYFVGVFVIGAFLGGILGGALCAVVGTSPEPLVLLILAILTGVVALFFQKFMIIMSTGFGGAWSVVTGIAYFTTGAIDPTRLESIFRASSVQMYVILLCWILLGLAGVMVQYKSAPAEKEAFRR